MAEMECGNMLGANGSYEVQPTLLSCTKNHRNKTDCDGIRLIGSLVP